MAAAEQKTTVYVDVDDEITSIIDKVRNSDGKVVALVLPKRAAMLQSVVNMKLLKRTAESAKKHLVLITTEASLLPLAGNVGLHVAATPTSKPSIPPVTAGPSDETEDINEDFAVTDHSQNDDDDFDSTAAGAVAVGALAAAGVQSKINPNTVDEDITMDDGGEALGASDPAPDDGADAATDASGKKVPKPKKNKKLAVPNFDSFRKKLWLGAGILVLLVVGYIFAFVVLPKATITIHTDTTTITTTANLTLDTTAKTVDPSSNTVPATAQTIQKTYSQQADSTGQKNNGIAATGSITFSAGTCSADFPADVSAGTGVSSGGQTYITQQSASFSAQNYHGHCTFQSGSVPITAASGGTKYNTDSSTFTVSGRPDVTGSGSASGGTDDITKIVSQADIDSATAKLATQDTAAIKQGLQAALQGKGLVPIETTFVATPPVITPSAKAGDATDTVTVTEVANYSMLGVKQSDLTTLVTANVNKQLDKGKQVILDDGVSKAVFVSSTTTAATATSASVSMKVSSVAGPQIDTTALAKQAAGKKAGDVVTTVKQTPGVTDVTVNYSPFWVSSVPTNTKKIMIVLVKSGTGSQ